MKIIGITGKSGSGKSTLTQVLSQELKCNYVNVDKIGHQATKNEKIGKQLCKVFGDEILSSDGIIDRKKLGNIVFSNKEKMDILTDITWGYMQEILDKILQKETGEVLVLEWALLPVDSKYWDKCNIKILMKADEEERKNKVIQRDHISEEYFLKRDASSFDYRPFSFDFVFENDYKIETMYKMANEIKKEIAK